MATHTHKTVRAWCLFFDNLDERATIFRSCEPAREAWDAGIGAWVEHALGCPACREIARIEGLLADGLDCPECLDQLQVVYDLLDVTEHYEPATVLELGRADQSVEELDPLPLNQQIGRVLSDHPFQQWGLARKLLLDAKAAWHRDPEHAHDRALLALTVTSTLDPESYGDRWIADLEANAHAYVANAHRILGRFRAAERAFLAAEACLRRGVGSGRMEARVFGLKASLLKDQHRHAEALALLDRVERFYAQHGEDHEVGRLALMRVAVLDYAGDPEAAARECHRAEGLLDPAREPDLVPAVRNSLVDLLVTTGETERARALFDQLPTLQEPIGEVHRRWVEGHILRAEQRYGDARKVYEAVRTAFADQGLFYRAALTSLDLAIAAYAENANRAEVRLMAEQAAVQLTRAGAKQEAFAALRLLFETVREEVVTLGVIESVRRRVAALQPS